MSRASSSTKCKQRKSLRYFCRAAGVLTLLSVFSVASMGSISSSLHVFDMGGVFRVDQQRQDSSNSMLRKALFRKISTLERRLGAPWQMKTDSDEMSHPSLKEPISQLETPNETESEHESPSEAASDEIAGFDNKPALVELPANSEPSEVTQLHNVDEASFETLKPPPEETPQSTTTSGQAEAFSPSQATSEASSFSALPIAEESDCLKIAPCRSEGDGGTLKCVTFYAKRFWDAAPSQISDNLQFHREHRPENTWYETEMLMFQRAEGDKSDVMPSDENVICKGDLPEKVTYLHNFKVAGTTARHSLLSSFGYPGYEVKAEIYSDLIDSMFPSITNATGDDYRDYVDTMKEEIYEGQKNKRNDNVAFTFVRSPVQRFISALEQILRHNNTEWELSLESRPCLESADHFQQVECFAKSMIDTRVFFNVHLYPQAYLFDTWTKYGSYDTAFTVLDLKAMDPLFKRFTGRDITRWRESKVDGTQYNFGERDLEPRLAALICQLYEVDVLMLKALGMEDPLCSRVMTSISDQ